MTIVIPSNTVLDAGKVRLGAGMKRQQAPAAAAPVAAPGAQTTATAGLAALIADAGTVRIGAGMRRAASAAKAG